MYKEHLALENQQWFICHENKPNQIIYTYVKEPIGERHL